MNEKKIVKLSWIYYQITLKRETSKETNSYIEEHLKNVMNVKSIYFYVGKFK